MPRSEVGKVIDLQKPICLRNFKKYSSNWANIPKPQCAYIRGQGSVRDIFLIGLGDVVLV